MTQAVAGPGWVVTHNGTTISEVLDVSGPGQKVDKDEATNQSSPNFYKEWVPTLLDGGDFMFSCNYIPGDSSQQGLLTAMQSRAIQAFTLTAPDPYSGETISFNGYVEGWDPKTPKSKIATLDVKVAVSGPVTV